MIYFDKETNIYRSTLLDKLGITHGFGTKQFGDGRDTSILAHYLSQKNITYTTIIAPHQTHSTTIQTISNPPELMPIPCDGVITAEQNVALSVVTADCVPLLFVDPVRKAIGISHQGWKGTLEQLPAMMVDTLVDQGSQAQDIICVAGPAISDCCYEVYGERQQAFKSKYGEAVFRLGTKAYLNLYQANYQTLVKQGIQRDHIDIFPFCTYCHSSQFYSYHRDGKIEGEMISFLLLS